MNFETVLKEFKRPLYPSRLQEFNAMRDYAAHYGVEIDEIDFDNAYADKYGGGIELEWPKE